MWGMQILWAPREKKKKKKKIYKIPIDKPLLLWKALVLSLMNSAKSDAIEVVELIN